MEIKIVNKSNHPLPSHETLLSAGLDLRANIEPNDNLEGKKVTALKSGEFKLIKTGLFIQLPEGFEAQIRARSGLAFKHGVTVLNSPGTIDADYTGEIGVILINHGEATFIINDGDRIAQMVIAKHEKVEWQLVEVLNITQRGEGGYGHTGK